MGDVGRCHGIGDDCVGRGWRVLVGCCSVCMDGQ